MQTKERHYHQIAELVPRYRGDFPDSQLTEQITRRFHAMTFLPPTARPGQPSLVATADGAIKRILFKIPNYAARETIMTAAYRGLFKALSSDVEFVVLAQESAAKTVKQWLEE